MDSSHVSLISKDTFEKFFSDILESLYGSGLFILLPVFSCVFVFPVFCSFVYF